jgi:hypothetical protein
MLMLPIPCLFVLLCLAVRSREPEEQVGTWNLKYEASCALDHFFLPSHVLINHNDLHRLILMGPSRLPYLTIFIPCLPLNFFGSTCYCFMWFWV